ncbi:uromodulin-like [Hyperolius riggenbachi]|uniref:uromodulin-like n=1 Tax=Hyperolius riggenbachi TaxID=752182 RepID=UPI0035A2E4B2
MFAYQNPDFSSPISVDSTLTVEQTIYLSISIPNLDANTFSVKVLRIYATGDAPSPVYNLTTDPNSCPNPIYGSDLISVVNNGNSSEARFTMKVFQITGSNHVYLKADVTLCSQTCPSNCQSRGLVRSDTTTSQVAKLTMELYGNDLSSNGASAGKVRMNITPTLETDSRSNSMETPDTVGGMVEDR